MSQEKPKSDPDLTPEQAEKAALLCKLDLNKIDETLLNNCCNFWRKVSRIIGATMNDLPNRPEGIPDIFYAQRVRKLVDDGKLEAQGDLNCMHFSEVRLPG